MGNLEAITSLLVSKLKSEYMPYKSKHAAAIIDNCGNCLSIGLNSDRLLKPFISTHAEMNALNKLKSKFIKKNQKIDILVLRLNKLHSNLSNSHPCIFCLLKMKKFPIRNVYYSDDNGNIVKCSLTKLLYFEPHYKCKKYL